MLFNIHLFTKNIQISTIYLNRILISIKHVDTQGNHNKKISIKIKIIMSLFYELKYNTIYYRKHM